MLLWLLLSMLESLVLKLVSFGLILIVLMILFLMILLLTGPNIDWPPKATPFAGGGSLPGPKLSLNAKNFSNRQPLY